MVALPRVLPLTTPEDVMLATEGALLLQKPLGVASLRVVVLLKQTELEPVIGDIEGTVPTVMVRTAKLVPQLLDTV